MKTLYLAWQAPNRQWFPIGQLDAEPEKSLFVYNYTQGALRAEREAGLSPLPTFPDFHGEYKSSELFPVFSNRILGSNRKDFAAYVRSLAMDPAANPDPIEMLAISGGERQTDSLEVFPKLEKDRQNRFVCRFFLHGLRYMTEEAQLRALRLVPEEPLQVSIELNNPTGELAVQLTTRDYYFIGWSPRYLVTDLLEAANGCSEIRAKIVRTNDQEVPLNRRILVEMNGEFPPTHKPMSGEDFHKVH